MVMSSTITAEQIENHITRDIGVCEVLLTLLDAEQEALQARDPQALSRIIEQKAEPLAQLEESARQRARWANISDGEAAGEKWNRLLTRLQHDRIKKDWERLKQLTHNCQQKNALNGKVLSRHQQIYGRLLDLLRGQTGAPDLYNACGATTGGRRSIKVDEA